MTDMELYSLLYPDRASRSDKKEPDYQYIHNELAKDGVTLSLLYGANTANLVMKKGQLYICRPNSTGNFGTTPA